MTLRVAEQLFVEGEGWVVSLEGPAEERSRVAPEAALVAGSRTWVVKQVFEAPVGFVGARLVGPWSVSKGLALKVVPYSLGEAEHREALRQVRNVCRAAFACQPPSIAVDRWATEEKDLALLFAIDGLRAALEKAGLVEYLVETHGKDFFV